MHVTKNQRFLASSAQRQLFADFHSAHFLWYLIFSDNLFRQSRALCHCVFLLLLKSKLKPEKQSAQAFRREEKPTQQHSRCCRDPFASKGNAMSVPLHAEHEHMRKEGKRIPMIFCDFSFAQNLLRFRKSSLMDPCRWRQDSCKCWKDCLRLHFRHTYTETWSSDRGQSVTQPQGGSNSQHSKVCS